VPATFDRLPNWRPGVGGALPLAHEGLGAADEPPGTTDWKRLQIPVISGAADFEGFPERIKMLAGKFSGPDEMFMEARDHAGVLGVSQPARKKQCFGDVKHPEICARGREISIAIVEEALRSGDASTRFFDKRVRLAAHATGVPSRRTFIKNGSRPCSNSARRAGRAEIRTPYSVNARPASSRILSCSFQTSS